MPFARPATAALLCALLTACATSGPDPKHRVVAYSGVVEAMTPVSGVEGSSGIYRPGMGGAAGGLIAAMLPKPGAAPRHTRYRIATVGGDGRPVFVGSTAAFEIGQCVDVMVEAKTDYVHFDYGWASLRPSSACKP